MTADQLKEFEREIWRSHIRATVEDLQRAVSICHAELVCVAMCSMEREGIMSCTVWYVFLLVHQRLY